jgi:hypothetical protein
VIEDLREPRRGNDRASPGHFGHRGLYVAPYVRLKARRLARVQSAPSTTLWMPGDA